MKPRYITLLIFLALSALILYGSWKNNIIFTDEILFEEAAYQMEKTNNFLIPHLQKKVWLEKPPLYFWFTAAIFRFSHPTPFTRRLPALITAIATLALTYKLARHFYKREIANWSIIILTTTPIFLYFTKTANLDIPAAFFITATIYTYLKAKLNTRWLPVSAIALGLGILTRSFLSLTPILIIAIDQLLLSKQKISTKLLTLSLALTLTLALPWHLYAWYKYPEIFTTKYLNFNLVSHLLEKTPGHETLSPFEFLANVLLKLNPLAVFALVIPLTKIKIKKAEKILLVWIAASLLPLTFSATRHEWYAIQALPPLAILSALGLTNLKKRLAVKLGKRWELVRVFALALILSLPISVFLAIPKQTKAVTILNNFINKTPSNTPLYNLQYQYTPQSSLYNPRETPILTLDQLEKIDKPLYLYLDNQKQLQAAQPKLRDCCTYDIFLDHEDSLILNIKPQ